MISKRMQWIWLPVVLAGAVALRMFHLGHQSLWIDEVASVVLVTLPAAKFWPALTGTIGSEANQPLYFVLLHYWTSMFGASEAAVRSLSVLFGTAALVFFYYWLRDLEDEAVARLALIVASISSFAVWYAQEARPYSVLLFCTCLVLFSYGRYWKEQKIGWLLLLAAGEVVGTYTSILFLGVVGALNLHWLVASWNRAKRMTWIASQAIWLALVAPFCWFNLTKVAAGAHTHDHANWFFSIGYAFWAFLLGFSIGPSVAQLHVPDKLSVVREYGPEVVVGAVISLLTVAVALAYGLRIGKRLFYTVLLVVPLLFVLCIFAMIHSTPVPRYWIMCLPVLWAIVGAGIVRARPRALGWVVLVALVGVNAYSLLRLWTNPTYQKEDYRAIAQYVREEGPTLPIIAIGPTTVLAYYGVESSIEVSSPSDATNALVAVAGANDGYWVVIDRARHWAWDPHGQGEKILVPGDSVIRKSLGGLDLYRVRSSATH